MRDVNVEDEGRPLESAGGERNIVSSSGSRVMSATVDVPSYAVDMSFQSRTRLSGREDACLLDDEEGVGCMS